MDNQRFLQHSKFWDRTGMLIAGVCVVHCLLFPFLIILLPTTGTFFKNPLLEAVILLLGIFVGSISFVTSFRKHRLPYPMMLGLSGVAFLTLNLFIFIERDSHFEVSGVALDPLMIVGGFLLIAGHGWNMHACHCFCDQDCEHHHHEQEEVSSPPPDANKGQH